MHLSKDKLEWIVYDTSKEDQKVEKLLPPLEEREKDNIKYIHNEKVIIGETRNSAVMECSNEIVIFNDDDDFYYRKM